MVDRSDDTPESALEKHLSEVIGRAVLHNLEVDQVALAIHAALCGHNPCPHTNHDITARDRARAKAAIREMRRWNAQDPGRTTGTQSDPPPAG